MIKDVEKICTFKKTQTEVVGLQVHTWKRRRYVDIRVWIKDPEGVNKPTRKGLTLNVNLLPDLEAAVDLALKKVKGFNKND